MSGKLKLDGKGQAAVRMEHLIVKHRQLADREALQKLAEDANLLVEEFIRVSPAQLKRRGAILREFKLVLYEFALIQSFGLDSVRKSD